MLIVGRSCLGRQDGIRSRPCTGIGILPELLFFIVAAPRHVTKFPHTGQARGGATFKWGSLATVPIDLRCAGVGCQACGLPPACWFRPTLTDGTLHSARGGGPREWKPCPCQGAAKGVSLGLRVGQHCCVQSLATRYSPSPYSKASTNLTGCGQKGRTWRVLDGPVHLLARTAHTVVR
jgi:hypothetical protein